MTRQLSGPPDPLPNLRRLPVMTFAPQSNDRIRAKPKTDSRSAATSLPVGRCAVHPIAEKLSGLRQVRDAVGIESHEPRAGEVCRHRIVRHHESPKISRRSMKGSREGSCDNAQQKPALLLSHAQKRGPERRESRAERKATPYSGVPTVGKPSNHTVSPLRATLTGIHSYIPVTNTPVCWALSQLPSC